MHTSTKEELKTYIYSIQTFIRNSSAVDGMTAMKIIMFFYGLKLIEPYIKKNKSEIPLFSKLVEFANESNGGDKIKSKLEEIYEELENEKNIDKIISCDIPRDLRVEFYKNIVLIINEIPINEKYMSISSKIYEFFIGRNKQDLQDLGAYFTDQHITKYIINDVKPVLNDGKMPSFMDPFGGSGSFTLQFVEYMIRHNSLDSEFLKGNISNVYHYDINLDVIKIAALEMFRLTHQIPDMNNNFKRTNTFTCNDFKKYKYILSTSPYGGDNNKEDITGKTMNALMLALKDSYYKKDEESGKMKWTEKWSKEQYKVLRKDIEDHNKELNMTKVNYNSSSDIIKDYIDAYDTGLDKKDKEFCLKEKVNDKESISLVLFMALLDNGGTCVAILKEGLFFIQNMPTSESA